MINKEITLFYAAFYYFQRKECELSLPMLKYYTVRTTREKRKLKPSLQGFQ